MFEPDSKLAGTIRSILLLISGVLIARGKSDAATFIDQYTPIILGIALAVSQLAWSVYDKIRVKREKAEAARLAEKQIEVAVTMPPTATVQDVKIEAMKQEIVSAAPPESECKE